MSDLIDSLRVDETCGDDDCIDPGHGVCMRWWAADEIERLRALVRSVPSCMSGGERDLWSRRADPQYDAALAEARDIAGGGDDE